MAKLRAHLRPAGLRMLAMKLKASAKNVVAFVAQIGGDPSDDDGLRLKKSLLVFGSISFSLAGLCWGVMYFALGARLALNHSNFI